MNPNWNRLIGGGLLAATLASCSTTQPEASSATAATTRTVEPEPAPDPLLAFADREMASYTVKAGDTLWDISRAYRVSVTDIKAANALERDTIFPDQVLKIPLPIGSLPNTSPDAPAIRAESDLASPGAPITGSEPPANLPPPVPTRPELEATGQ